MSQIELDRTDLKILAVLQSDGRITNQRLAKRVSLSPSACLTRRHLLESSGVILGYRALVALELVRKVMVVYAELTMKHHEPSVFEHFEAILSGTPEIVEASRVSGPFDYLLKVVVTDMEEWKELSLSILNEANGVRKLMTWVVMQEVKPCSAAPINDSPSLVRRLRQPRKHIRAGSSKEMG